VAPLRHLATESVLLFDFDGTLSGLVDDPGAAAPATGVPDLLGRLAAAYRRVGVLSGRPVSFLAQHLPPTVALSGLYGLESRIDGVDHAHPDAARWRPIVAEAVVAAGVAAGPDGEAAGVLVEAKDLSITLHVRTRPELQAAAEALAARLAQQSGLVVRPAKMSVELHPPIEADKGSALELMVGEAAGVLFAGDDVGDLPALDALARFGPEVVTLAVVVDGPELPDAVRSRAELLLPDQAAIIDLLEALQV
jgi:trehalose 6-phosphate phosphatase